VASLSVHSSSHSWLAAGVGAEVALIGPADSRLACSVPPSAHRARRPTHSADRDRPASLNPSPCSGPTASSDDARRPQPRFCTSVEPDLVIASRQARCHVGMSRLELGDSRVNDQVRGHRTRPCVRPRAAGVRRTWTFRLRRLRVGSIPFRQAHDHLVCACIHVRDDFRMASEVALSSTCTSQCFLATCLPPVPRTAPRDVPER